MPSIFIATSPVSSILLSAFQDKAFNPFAEAMKTVGLRSWGLLFGMGRGRFVCSCRLRVCRLMKLLCNHLSDADTTCRSHGISQRLHGHSLKLLLTSVCILIVVSPRQAAKALLRLLQPTAQQNGLKILR